MLLRRAQRLSHLNQALPIRLHPRGASVWVSHHHANINDAFRADETIAEKPLKDASPVASSPSTPLFQRIHEITARFNLNTEDGLFFRYIYLTDNPINRFVIIVEKEHIEPVRPPVK